MTIPRHGILASVVPRHNRLPTAQDGAIWAPLHGAFDTLAYLDDVIEVIEAGSANAAKWTANPLFYTFPTDNGGGTNNVALLWGHDTYDLLDDCLTLIGAAVDTQIVISQSVIFGDQSGSYGYLWCYGNTSSAASMYGVALAQTSELPSFAHRGKGATGITNMDVGSGLTLASGTALSDAGYKGVRVVSVTGLRVTGAQTVDIELAFGAAGGGPSCVYTGSIDFAATSSTMPGRGGEETHRGLYLGSRGQSDGSAFHFFGRGATHTACLGNANARRFASFDSGRVADVLSEVLARNGDFPNSFLEAA